MITNIRRDYIHSKAVPVLITKLLTERQEILVLFNQLVEMKPYDKAAAVQPLLQQFCQVLVDYIALGHFEVYQCLEGNVDDTEHCRRVKGLIRELYPRIVETTQTAIDFNDRYDGKEPSEMVEDLCINLSRLGENLAARIELEDRLITAIKLSSPANTRLVTT